MSISELETSLANLDWQRTRHPEKHEANLDEVAIQSLLMASILRNLGRFDDARKTLQEDILKHEAYVASFLSSLNMTNKFSFSELNSKDIFATTGPTPQHTTKWPS
jgi:hypothetical protein